MAKKPTTGEESTAGGTIPNFKPGSGPASPPLTHPLGPKQSDDGKAWLVVHDERTREQTYELTPGKHVVGRKSPDRPCDWMIETEDMYMSRNHFVVEVVRSPAGGFNYLLSDYQSTNHTFINLMELRHQDQYRLLDGTVIQAGHTKIIFRTTASGARTAREATQLVTSQKFEKTVIIKS